MNLFNLADLGDSSGSIDSQFKVCPTPGKNRHGKRDRECENLSIAASGFNLVRYEH